MLTRVQYSTCTVCDYMYVYIPWTDLEIKFIKGKNSKEN